MNRKELDMIAMVIDGRVAKARQDEIRGDIRLEELRITAHGIASSLNVDPVRFLRSCGFTSKEKK